MWEIVYSKQALKDSRKFAEAGLKGKTIALLDLMRLDPSTNHPPFVKLVGDLAGTYSSRITFKQRLVYQLFGDEKIIRVLRMWTHYE